MNAAPAELNRKPFSANLELALPINNSVPLTSILPAKVADKSLAYCAIVEPPLFLKVMLPLEVLAVTLSTITVGVTTLPAKVELLPENSTQVLI